MVFIRSGSFAFDPHVNLEHQSIYLSLRSASGSQFLAYFRCFPPTWSNAWMMGNCKMSAIGSHPEVATVAMALALKNDEKTPKNISQTPGSGIASRVS